MNKEKTIDVLNTLLEVNNDRIAGYETASKQTQEPDLKILFSEFMQTSHKCKNELASEVLKLGGVPIEGTSSSGKLFRAWMDIKAALTGKARHAILNSCETGEDAAVEAYRKALRDNLDDITALQQDFLNAQFTRIKTGHDKIIALRDALVESN